jgi:hypothetical protein
MIEHGRAHLVQGGERRRLGHVLQKRRLPDPGLATQHQRAALTVANGRDHPVEDRALAAPPAQSGQPFTRHDGRP